MVPKRRNWNIGIDCKHPPVRQEIPTFLVIGIEFASAGWSPGQTFGIEQSRLRGAAIRLHVGAIGQDDALSVSDAGPSGWRGDRLPDVAQGIVDSAAGGPIGVEEVVFSAHDDDAAIR